MNKEMNWEDVMQFGKYEGLSIAEIFNKDVEYLYYLDNQQLVEFEEDLHKELFTIHEEEKRYDNNRM